jgi:hypothetical protein
MVAVVFLLRVLDVNKLALYTIFRDGSPLNCSVNQGAPPFTFRGVPGGHRCHRMGSLVVVSFLDLNYRG